MGSYEINSFLVIHNHRFYGIVETDEDYRGTVATVVPLDWLQFEIAIAGVDLEVPLRVRCRRKNWDRFFSDESLLRDLSGAYDVVSLASVFFRHGFVCLPSTDVYKHLLDAGVPGVPDWKEYRQLSKTRVARLEFLNRAFGVKEQFEVWLEFGGREYRLVGLCPEYALLKKNEDRLVIDLRPVQRAVIRQDWVELPEIGFSASIHSERWQSFEVVGYG